jgi:PKD repeat protein
VTIEANLFDYNRHHIASSGWPYSSYEARFNLSLDHSSSHAIDRHGTLDPGSWVGGDGGEWTRVHHNTVRDTTQRAFSLRGTPTKGAEVHHNWFLHADEAAAISVHSSVTTHYTIADNAFGPTPPAGTCLPVARLQAAPSTGPAPLAVSFTSAGSAFADGTLVSYVWDFGDGQTATGAQASHLYPEPGVYYASLTVRDNRGVPVTAYTTITVTPPAGKTVLSFWIKDGTRKQLPGYCYKQALIGNTVVFDEDVSGPGGWKHVQLDVTGHLASATQAQIKFRAICKQAISNSDTQLTALSVLVDDVYLSRGAVKNSHFESKSDWTYTENGSGWSGGYFSGDVWTGRMAYRLLLPYRTTTGAGTWAQIAQTVALTGP